MSMYTIGTPGVFGATPTSLSIYDADMQSSGGPQQLVLYGTATSGVVGTCFFRPQRTRRQRSTSRQNSKLQCAGGLCERLSSKARRSFAVLLLEERYSK